MDNSGLGWLLSPQQVLVTEGTVSLLADSPATDESAPGCAARAAYVETLENLLCRCTTPDGEHWTPYSVEYTGAFEDMSQNTFALADVDGDGRAELVLMTRPNIYTGYRVYILDYDASANTIRIQHTVHVPEGRGKGLPRTRTTIKLPV